MMSMIGIGSQLAPAATQLPVHAYSDPQWFLKEKSLIFDVAPRYVGHALMAPQPGDYRTIDACNHAQMIINNGGRHELLSNVCRHRQATLFHGQGHLDSSVIVCPVHRWTYHGSGERLGTLMGAPHFPSNPCLNLGKETLQSWHGLLFTGPRSVADDLAAMQVAPVFDFSGYKLDRVVEHVCHYNWKTFIEVYLEDYHVEPYHPGLGGFVTCHDLSWQFGEWYSVQKVGLNSLANPGSRVYQRWHSAVQNYAAASGQQPKQGAVWLTYYPNIMVEWYPNVLVVSTLIAKAVDQTVNLVEFYYPEEIVEFEREFVDAQQAAYMETAIEDDDIAERMDRGRRGLALLGKNEVGPYQSPMEDGMQHFHEFYRERMRLAGEL